MPSGGWKIRRGLIAAAFGLLAPPAFAGPDYSGSYLCIQEAGGGLYYFGEERGWGGTVFNPKGKFVIKLTKQGEEPAFKDSKLNIATYFVVMNDFGSKEQTCFGLAGDGTVKLWDNDAVIHCETTTSVWFSLDTMRFLTAYPYGYLDDTKNNDNTPAMMGGTCAKI